IVPLIHRTRGKCKGEKQQGKATNHQKQTNNYNTLVSGKRVRKLRPTIKFARIVVENLEAGSPADRAKGSKAHLPHFIVAVQKICPAENRHNGNDDGEEPKRPSERAVCME